MLTTADINYGVSVYIDQVCHQAQFSAKYIAFITDLMMFSISMVSATLTHVSV